MLDFLKTRLISQKHQNPEQLYQQELSQPDTYMKDIATWSVQLIYYHRNIVQSSGDPWQAA